MSSNPSAPPVGRYIFYVAVVILMLVALLFGSVAGCASYNRYQRRANVANEIHVQNQQLALYALKIKQAIKLAQVKKETAVGQKLANEQIAKRLTPIFVQYEMIEALKDIAASGRNNSIIYIPTGANGIPLIAPAGPQVYQPNPTGRTK